MQRPDNHSPLLLNAKQAAQTLSISPRTLWTLTHSGTIPSVRIGRSVRYPLTGLQEWIESQQQVAQ